MLTHVVAMAFSHRPVSGTAATGAGAGFIGFFAESAGVSVITPAGADATGSLRGEESTRTSAPRMPGARVESAALPAAPALSVPVVECPIDRDTTYPTAMITAIARLDNMRMRVTRPRDDRVDVRQFGQAPMAAGRCTPQIGQFNTGTCLPVPSYDTNGAWQRGQRVAPTNALAPQALQFV
jgi:hypothetical protein